MQGRCGKLRSKPLDAKNLSYTKPVFLKTKVLLSETNKQTKNQNTKKLAQM